MAVSDEIIAARGGDIHCGLSSMMSPSVSDLASEFGLDDDPANYKEIDAIAARRLVQLILHRDLAYGVEIMSAIRAGELADAFFSQFGTDPVRFLTNGNFHETEEASWTPVTLATFDTGVLVIGPRSCGCLWVEDED